MSLATWAVVAVVALGCGGVALRAGLGWNAHVAAKATQQLDTARKTIDTITVERDQWKGRYDAEKTDHADAVQARTKAVAEARAARARLAESERVRNAAGAGGAKAGPQKAPATGVLGLPALSWGGQGGQPARGR